MSKFIAGDLVYARTNPNQQLVVRRLLDRVYYCKVKGKVGERELMYFERELVAGASYSLIPKDENNPEASEHLFWN